MTTKVPTALLEGTALTAFGGLTLAADRLPYATGASTMALATFTEFARTLLDGEDAEAARGNLGLGALATVNSVGAATINDDSVGNAKLRDSAALSVIGRSANSTGDPADIAAGADGHVLRRSGTTLGFGQITIASHSDIVTGDYAPTFTNGANMDSAASSIVHYKRVGNHVDLWGGVSIDPGSGAVGTATDFYMTVPIASNFGTTSDAAGVFTAQSGGPYCGTIRAEVGTRLQFNFASQHTGAITYRFWVSYKII